MQLGQPNSHAHTAVGWLYAQSERLTQPQWFAITIGLALSIRFTKPVRFTFGLTFTFGLPLSIQFAKSIRLARPNGSAG